jgi:hypothetical protein
VEQFSTLLRTITYAVGLSIAALIAVAAMVLAAPAIAKQKRPDLVMKSVSAPSSVDVGKAFRATDVVRNKGRRTAKRSKVSYSLSNSATPGGSAVVLGTRSVPKLKPKKQSSGSANLVVPDRTKAAEYFLIACAGGKFKEMSKRNNCKTAPHPITVVAAKPASISVSPANGTLASTLIGQVSPPTTFTVSNDGDTPSGPVSTQFGAAPFSNVPAADACTGETLAPRASCTFQVVFTPTQRGPAQSQVSIGAQPGGTVNVPISGSGLAPASLSISDSSGPDPVSWDFGSATVGSDGPSPHTFDVTNNGDVATGSLTVELTGFSFNDFLLTGGSCLGNVPLGPGSTCTVIANFHPLTSGAKETTLEVSGSPGGSASTKVTGQGQTAPSLSLSPILHDFGGVPFNSFRDFTFTITNSGQATTSAISLAISGTNANRFQTLSAGDTCSGQSLNGGGSCSFTVRFTPLNIGAKSAFVGFSADVGGVGSAALSGTGT